MLNLDEKQLRSLQSRVNIRRFFDYVSTGQTEKITKLCSKGLDPNTHLESGGSLYFLILLFLLLLLQKYVTISFDVKTL